MTQPDHRDMPPPETIHRYDSNGVCIFCHRCDDDYCCEQVPCDRRAWHGMDERQREVARAYFGDLP